MSVTPKQKQRKQSAWLVAFSLNEGGRHTPAFAVVHRMKTVFEQSKEKRVQQPTK